MKKYVFITCSVLGIGGGQRYASNKAEYIRKKGYKVGSISTSIFSRSGKLFYDGLRQGENYVLTQLRHHPDTYPRRKRERIIQKAADLITIDATDEIILESNNLTSALWAERIAERIQAKHVVFSISEHNVIDDYMCDFLEFKFSRGEFASINIKSFCELLEKSRIITKENLPILQANLGDPVEDVADARLENFEKSDYNICIIGRGEKRYVEYACEEVVAFCKRHKDKTFSVGLVSKFMDVKLEKKMQALFDSAENIKLYYWGYFMPFPRAFFDLFDLYIGGAGCASLPYRQNVLTLAMDLYNDRALGLMGYDGCTSTIASDENWNTAECLEDALFCKNYLKKQYTRPIVQTTDDSYSQHDRLFCSGSREKQYYTVVDYRIGLKEKAKTAFPFLVMIRKKLVR